MSHQTLNRVIGRRIDALRLRHEELKASGEDIPSLLVFLNKDETLSTLRQAYELIAHEMSFIIPKNYRG